MYSALDLAEMFNTTKKTVYLKLKDESISKYTIRKDGGLKLLDEGLKEFNKLIETSRVKESILTSKKIGTKSEPNTEYISELKNHIISLKKQIDELKKSYESSVEHLKKESFDKTELLKNMQILLKEQQLLTGSKKNWWQFWKN